jgi:hypothetical protein
VTFLRAYLRTDARYGEVEGPEAGTWPMARLVRMKGVEGGPADSLRVDVHVPEAQPGGDPVAIEFHNESLGHYLTTADAAEAAAAGPGWWPTGHGFRVSRPGGTSRLDTLQSAPACRFQPVAAAASAARFLTADKAECRALASSGSWRYEGAAFWVIPHDSGRNCPPGMRAVMRARSGASPGGDPAPRYTTSNSTMRDMERAGWTDEGIVWCSAGY